MIKTIGDLKQALSKVPDDKEVVVMVSKEHLNGTVGLIQEIDEWVEGVTILCRTHTLEDNERMVED